MPAIETMKIQNPDKKGEFLIINQCDFDPKTHKEFGAKEAKAEKGDEPSEITLETVGTATKAELVAFAEANSLEVPKNAKADDVRAIVEAFLVTPPALD